MLREARKNTPLLCRSRGCGLHVVKEQVNGWGWHKVNSVVLFVSLCPTTAMNQVKKHDKSTGARP